MYGAISTHHSDEEVEHVGVVYHRKGSDTSTSLVLVLSTLVFLVTTLAVSSSFFEGRVDSSNLKESASSTEFFRPMVLSSAAHHLRIALENVAKSENILFGHQLDTVTGQFFDDYSGDYQNKSDILNATGSYPAVEGFGFKYIIEGYDFSRHIRDARSRGGVVTFDWSADNPVTLQNCYNKSGNPIVELMPGGSVNGVWVGWLDQIAYFLGNNSDVPIVFRLFHEMTGGWFWWGKDTCNSTEFKDAWKYTVGYLRIRHNLTNILFLYATSRMIPYNDTEMRWVEDNMVTRYPGNDYVDAIGFDCYDNFTWFKQSLNQSCETVFAFALKNGRIPMIGETWHKPHHSDCLDCGEWWSEFYDVYADIEYSMCHNAAYMLVWANYEHDDYYTPLPQQAQFPRFSNFQKNKEIQFSNSTYWTENAKITGYV